MQVFTCISTVRPPGHQSQAVTHHLALLEAANLVVTTWRGREKLHFLNPVPLQDIYERWIRGFERSRLRAMRDLKRRLEETRSAGRDDR